MNSDTENSLIIIPDQSFDIDTQEILNALSEQENAVCQRLLNGESIRTIAKTMCIPKDSIESIAITVFADVLKDYCNRGIK